jgi:hypothetical protein
MAGETKINHIVYQADPWSTIWGLRDDGSLVSYVYLREQKLSGWARHDVGGFVESIAVIPSPDYEESQLWLSVRRTINGVEKRYVEVIESMNTHKQYEKDWWCVDCGSVYEGVSVSTISGLDYLEGHTVVYLADGAIGKETVVTNGKITLQTPASKVVVGLPIMAVVKTLPLDLNQGTIQGKQKVIHKVRIDKYMSYGGKIGSGLDKLDILFDTPNYSLAKMSSDSKTINYNGGWNREGQIYIVQDKPVPLFIKGIEYTFTLGS